MTTTPIAPGATRYTGTRLPRVEDLRLLTGRGGFVDDVVRPGMLHAVFVRSPFARAGIGGIDVTEALAAPGVRAVFTAADVNPHVHEQWYGMYGPMAPTTPLPPLADEARFVGDPVAVVVATSRAAAVDAAELVVVDYEPLPAVTDYETARTVEGTVHADYPDNVIGSMGVPSEEAAAAFEHAAHVARETIHQQAYLAAPIETRGMVAEWSGAGGELTLWTASQSPSEVRAFTARLLGLPESKVRAIMRDTGGAFGQKVNVSREEMVVAIIATLLPAAVKWVEDRRENILAAGFSRREHADCRFAFDADGAILAADIDFVSDCGAYPFPWPVGTAMATGMLFPGPYRVPAASCNVTCIFSNYSGRTAYRGPWMYETLAREMLLDIAAREMGLDPADLRRRNLLRLDEMPYARPGGMPHDHIDPLGTFEFLLDQVDYDAFRREQAEARAQGRYLGIGTGSYVEPTTAGMGNMGSEGATIRMDPSGAVSVYVTGGAAGNSTETTAIQLAADALAIDPSRINTVQGDTAVVPYGMGTAGSRSGGMIAGAVGKAAGILREKIVALAAHQLEAAPEDIELDNGRAYVRGSVDRGVDYAELAALTYSQPGMLPEGMEGGMEVSARWTNPASTVWANASHACIVEVDLETGKVDILRYVVAEDCGAMINPNIVEGQVTGGTVQGIAGVLFEHFTNDEDGNPITTSFMDYLVPSAADVPGIEIGHIETPGPNEGGYKGVGEGGAIAAPAAVANAVADALAPLGVKITRMPLGPAEIVRLVDEARA